MLKKLSLSLALLTGSLTLQAAGLLVEAERFSCKGGWVVDQQFMDLMGSPYLLAHGLGVPVDDAFTDVQFPEKGDSYVYVRTYNWTSPWYDGEGPGKFALSRGNDRLLSPLGAEGSGWMWQLAGKVKVNDINNRITLHDLTGFDGRCDAVYFTTDAAEIPPAEPAALEAFRRRLNGLPDTPASAGNYDLVVVGGGVAGISAAVTAARLGCRVALINDRPVLGGNNSSEIRVHLGGRIEAAPYTNLGNLQKEFGPDRGGNAQPADYYEDDKKQQIVEAEENITLFPSTRATGVILSGNTIRSVIARHIETGEELRFDAPLFSDCTGDGTIGYLAGADYIMGREGPDEFCESTAPKTADKPPLGASVQRNTVYNCAPAGFPHSCNGVPCYAHTCEKVTWCE